MKKDILSLTETELLSEIIALGEKPYRAAQVFSWLHKNNGADFENLSTAPKTLRLTLAENFYIPKIRRIKILESDETKKYLFEIENDIIIESVSMRYERGVSVCVSSQAGCRMGCVFCASGVSGLSRNLSAGEMLSQAYAIGREAGERIASAVVMGCGEPLDNYDALIKFIEILNSKNGLNIGQRHITVSTCGLVDRINDLAKLKLQINLAVSLHAPNDKIRKSLMPVARKYNMDELVSACVNYSEKTGRRVSYEYALISGVNDSADHARELGQRLKNTLCHVNIININEIKEASFRRSGEDTAKRFVSLLSDYGLAVTKRRELGGNINAACGQLRSDTFKNEV